MSDQAPPPEEPTPGQPPQGQPPQGQPAPGGSPYGSAPPPPMPAMPPAGPGGSRPYSAPSAISYGWSKFTRSPGQLLVPVLIVAVVVIVLEILVQIVLRATLLGTHSCTQTIFGNTVQTQCGPGFTIGLIGAGIAGFVISLFAQALGAGLIKAGLNVADERPVSMSEVFSYVTKGNVIVAALIVSAATAIGTILCYFPGIIVAFLLAFTMYFVVDQDMAPMDAVRASYKFTTGHLGETILFYLLAGLMLIVGALLCLVGLLAAVPVALIGGAYTYRVLQNQPVSPTA
jgi:uncharacterized membrane protein